MPVGARPSGILPGTAHMNASSQTGALSPWARALRGRTNKRTQAPACAKGTRARAHAHVRAVHPGDGTNMATNTRSISDILLSG